MGTWTLRSVTLDEMTPMDDGQLFGTNVHVTYTLVYDQKGDFTETPQLDWHEHIRMKEHHKGEWWEFEANMYTHNPTSKTLEVWPKRYVVAYDQVMGTPFAGKGSSTLLKKDGRQLAPRDLKTGLRDNAEKADEVRKYLRRKGGILEIKIHDIPSIRYPKALAPTPLPPAALSEHKERLLQFNVGVVGSGAPRCQMEQYLDVRGDKEKREWIREDNRSSLREWNPDGLRRSDPPQQVTAPRTPLLFPGEYL